MRRCSMMRKTILIAVTILSLCLLALPQDQQDQQDQKRSPSTPDERKRFVALVHKLEKTPLDPSLNSEATWALQWLNDVPDVTVNICFSPLGHFADEQYRYDSRIKGVFVLGMAVYLIEHPQKAADNSAVYLAGVESALKAYRAILKTKPEAKSRGLDELVAKEDEGLLQDYVHDASGACEDTNQT
jgi:hypothetical protein